MEFFYLRGYDYPKRLFAKEIDFDNNVILLYDNTVIEFTEYNWNYDMEVYEFSLPENY
jgi:hypothetical protein